MWSSRLLTLLLIWTCHTYGETRDPRPLWQVPLKDVRVGVRLLRRAPLAFVDESRVRVFLRLKNESGRSLFVGAFALSHRNNDGALLHDVFPEPACRAQLDALARPAGAEPLPIGYSQFVHVYSSVEIKPSSTFEFSIPADHLADSRCIRIRYWSDKELHPTKDSDYSFVWFGVKGEWLRKER